MRSPSRILSLAMVTAAAWLAPRGVAANDVAFGGAGADPVPLTENGVQMLSEDIVIERMAPGGYRILGDGHWRVQATYRFRNLSVKPRRVQMGFPEPACPKDGDCDFTGFADMTTTVRGAITKLTVGAVDRRLSWAAHIVKVHLFEVTFAPSETVEVVHSYRHGLSEYINGGEDLTYITRTGALWAGTIEAARFRIRLPYRPWGLSLGPSGAQLVRFTETVAGGKPRVELDLQRTNWEPEHDVSFYLGPGFPTLETPSLISGCPSHGELFDLAIAVDSVDFADLVKKTRSLSNAQLRICRNAVFAHHGKDFEDPELDVFFYGARGLKVLTFDEIPLRSGAVFARNPDFADSMLTDPELAYVKALQMVEQQRK